ncbi:TRAP transporter permease [Azospirillum sp. ST 5-10]|uniref:TRAP transporter permease n=1 Tax=unclassified Azospirillum TaxID=2630922 RepID=UPI003F4A0CF0
MTTPPTTPARHDDDAPLTEAQIQDLVEEYDPESNFRRVVGFGALVITVLSVALSSWHLYTAGFGLLNEIAHRATHLATVLALVFLVFPRQKHARPAADWLVSIGFAAFYLYIGWDLVQAMPATAAGEGWVFFAGIAVLSLLSLPIGSRGSGPHAHIPVRDWVFAAAASSFSLYLLLNFDNVFIARVGQPIPVDYMMGVVAIVMVTEATRRTMGLFLPILGIACLLYGMLGPWLPGMLAHRGYTITRIVNHLYLGTEGIYGIPVGVVATYVYHFVLFGVLAQATGLGQIFIDLATIVAGRYSGGPAKVSVVSSGLFGMISGSAIANTVTTGALTIPMMKRVGFSSRFAAATEAASSCGGQITPPIMGASAFVMAETLGIPYTDLIAVAIVPAIMHYLAILLMVHLEARRLGLSGMTAADIPRIGQVFARGWHLLIPLVVMVALLLMRYTPFLAAFWGIILTILCSYIPLLLRPLGVTGMTGTAMTPKALVEGFEFGAKYALGIGAACACVGFILGITTLTGVGFKFSAAVFSASGGLAEAVKAFDLLNLIDLKQLTVFFGLILTAIACIIMGTGIPTTPSYIILAAIVAPALAMLDVPLLATHFFVFYFGVLADVTPPVALAAFAAAGIAGSEPMRTGMTAFRLSMGKATVPFMFVYAPSLLFIDFAWDRFTVAFTSGVLGIVALGAAFTGWFGRPLDTASKLALMVAGTCLIFNNWWLIALGAVVTLALLTWHGTAERRMVRRVAG